MTNNGVIRSLRQANKLIALVRVAGCLLCASALLPNAAHTQTVFTPQMTQALNADVHLQAGRTTLGAAVGELARQTGLNIECADYLQAHRLTLNIEHASAMDVLNQIAELTNVRWTEAGAKRITMARARAGSPDNPLQISAALKAVLPADILRYLGFNVPEGLWLTPEQKKRREEWQTTSSAITAFLTKDSPLGLGISIQNRVEVLMNDTGKNMWEGVMSDLRPNQKIVYTQCVPFVQKDIVLEIVDHALSSMGAASTVAMLRENFDAMYRDPMLTVIEIKHPSSALGQDMFMMGYYEPFGNGGDRYTGFGTDMRRFKDVLPNSGHPQ